MSGVILTLLEQPGTTSGLLVASERLAELMGGAQIDVFVVRTPPEATILPSEEVLTKRQFTLVRERERARASALRAAFDQWQAERRIETLSVRWWDLEGLVDGAIKEWGPRADMIVLRFPGGDDWHPAQQAVYTALFETDRPVLIVPAGPPVPFGRRVAIAWRDDRQATRAVLSALRCRHAPKRVLVLAGERQGSPRPVVPDILLEHGIEAELQVLPIGKGAFGKTLLTKTHELAGDMLVMGAYRHSALREFILGGLTRYILGHADLPVLMRR
ncbi:MAG TPA: universal stress protein [Rhodopila sp.]|jgi:nucleotide-binding universal stress UspA family protein